MSTSDTTEHADAEPTGPQRMSGEELDRVVGGYLPIGYFITLQTDTSNGLIKYVLRSPRGAIVGAYYSRERAEAAAYDHLNQMNQNP